jgi:hypothetical protein
VAAQVQVDLLRLVLGTYRILVERAGQVLILGLIEEPEVVPLARQETAKTEEMVKMAVVVGVVVLTVDHQLTARMDKSLLAV